MKFCLLFFVAIAALIVQDDSYWCIAKRNFMATKKTDVASIGQFVLWLIFGALYEKIGLVGFNLGKLASNVENKTRISAGPITVYSAEVIGPSLKQQERFFYFPGGDNGTYHLVDTEEPVDFSFIYEYTRNPAHNTYWLFTRANPSAAQTLVLGDANSVLNSNFDNSKDTVVLVHGWHGYGGDEMCQTLTGAFLESGDVNVIIIDWSHLAKRNYLTAKCGLAGVGKGLGQFLMWLTNFGLHYEQIHLVGFSLGGHLIGLAGRETGGRVGRITALDPAGLLYTCYSRDRLKKTDAQYVEVIHTTTYVGYSSPCGHADFYPNGGSRMTGCWLNSSCSHRKSFKYMASSVRHNHLKANECRSRRDASKNKCRGSLYPMGNGDLSKSRHGIFRVDTRSKYPY